MNAKDLIGCQAIRTKPAEYSNGVKDNSYGDNSILILAATDSHIIFKYTEDSVEFRIFGDIKRTLNSVWCDNNWTDYNELLRMAQATEQRLGDANIGKDN